MDDPGTALTERDERRRADRTHDARLVRENRNGERGAAHASAGQKVILAGMLAPSERVRHPDDRRQVERDDPDVERREGRCHGFWS
jgi:hypothetical protein